MERLSALMKRNHPFPKDVPKDVKYYSNYDEALQNPSDVVVIANPTAMHVPYAQKALKAGCHVYLEKPVSHSLDGVDRLLELQQNKNCVVQVGCQLRCHPQLVKIKEWINSGNLGTVHSVVADVGEYLPDWHPWEDYRTSYAARNDQGGGVILTMIHEFDYLYWFFGPLFVEHAIGMKRTSLEIDVEDTALIALMSEDGVPIHLRMDYWRRPPTRTLNIVAEKGEVSWDYHKKKLQVFSEGKLIEEDRLSEDWDWNELFIDMMKDFLAAVNGNGSVCSSLNDGIEVLKLAVTAKDKIEIREIK
jgi:predicted dehydrogenase